MSKEEDLLLSMHFQDAFFYQKKKMNWIHEIWHDHTNFSYFPNKFSKLLSHCKKILMIGYFKNAQNHTCELSLPNTRGFQLHWQTTEYLIIHCKSKFAQHNPNNYICKKLKKSFS